MGHQFAQKWRLVIEADQRVIAGQRGDRRERRRRRQIEPMGVEPETDRSDPPRHQRLLARAHHAHRDVGFAAQQILHPIGKREFDL